MLVNASLIRWFSVVDESKGRAFVCVSLALNRGVMSLAVPYGTAIFSSKDYFNVNCLVFVDFLGLPRAFSSR